MLISMRSLSLSIGLSLALVPFVACAKKSSSPDPATSSPVASPTPVPVGPAAPVVTTAPPPASTPLPTTVAQLTTASTIFMSMCQNAGGLQQPGTSGAAVACTCGTYSTTLTTFMAGDYVQDHTGASFYNRCISQRGGTAGTTQSPTLSTPAQLAAASAFANGCQALSSAGAVYYNQSSTSSEPQCLCGGSTITLSFFEADTVAGYLANTGDTQAKAFQASCQASLNASTIANGAITTTSGSCKLETAYANGANGLAHYWCVLRNTSGRLVVYTDRTSPVDGLSDTDCSVDCPFLTSQFSQY